MENNHEELFALLEESAELLDEVRTGEDFECKCWDQAEKLRTFIKAEKTKIKLAIKPV